MLKSVKYSSQNHISVYDNGVLKNKFGIHDEGKLHHIEEGIVLSLITHIYNEGFPGNFDKSHLLAIHKYLFSNIYYFAGVIRAENIIKDETLFCQFHLIDQALDNLFLNLSNVKVKNKSELALAIALFYSELNMIHPFREGNGRTSRIFFKLYARSIGYDINFEKVDTEDMLKSTIYSVANDNSKLEDIFKRIITKIP